MRQFFLLLALHLIFLGSIVGQSTLRPSYTSEDSIRGSVRQERSWWDLEHYDLHVAVHPSDSTITGMNIITYEVLDTFQVMQIDLQSPLVIISIIQDGIELNWKSQGAAHFVQLQKKQHKGAHEKIQVSYAGQPHIAVRPPWDGGITWRQDKNGKPFIASSCQGIGASVWWPCKDHMSDEVDSMNISITTPPGLMDVSNGRLVKVDHHDNGASTYHWTVRNPISNYGVNLSVGDYIHWEETYDGEKGPLSLQFFAHRDNEAAARRQFKQTHGMLDAFEHWFGPYPFYEDGFKLVEVPYLGMEHQSSVTYGNGYENGYLGRDLSDSGWGLTFDFIIIHEAGHEWFANNITYKDRADMWIHESFTAYSEALYVEYHNGKEAGADYVIGTRKIISNDRPIIADYGVNAVGSSDMYYKGSNMLHTLRQLVEDDDKWRSMLRGLNKKFYHKTVTSTQIENYMSKFLGIDLQQFFDQYLRTTDRPILEYDWKDGQFRYRWTHVVPGFDMPLFIKLDGADREIRPSANWGSIKYKTKPNSVVINPNFYVASMNVTGF